MKKQNFRKIGDYAIVGGLGAALVTGLIGCGNTSEEQQQAQQNSVSQAAAKQNAFVIVEALPNGGYTIADEYPADKTTVVLRELDGTERILSQAEIDALVKEEANKIDQGTSALTNPEVSSGQMGLGGILLSSLAGAMIGSWIGNKLFNNQNFQNQRAAQYKSPQTYSRSANSANAPKSTATKSSSNKSSGFFNNKTSNSSKSTNSSFGS